MKRHTLFIYMAALLTMLGAMLPMSAQAQEKKDALYIYRNDGKFHGFFYSDIVRICYSNIDTLGVEHDDFVVQEIYALDSVFRIPVSAIDSVSFVTPKTEYQPNVVTPESSLWNYVIASDSITTITLSPSTPSSLIPKVGDKLANASSTPYLPAGFLGKVASVNKGGGGTVVTVEGVEPTELFKRFVSKYAGRVETPGAAARNRANRRRANTIAEDYNATETNVPLPPIHLNLDLNTGKALGGWSVKLGDDFSVTGEGHFMFSLEPSLIVRSFFEVSQEDGTFFDLTTRIQADIDYELEAKAQASLSVDLGLPTFPFPLGYGFWAEYEVGDVFGISGEIAIKQNWHNSTSAYGMVQWIKGYKSDYAGSIHTLDDNWSSSLTGTMTLNAGFYHQVKVKFMDKKILEAALRFETGFKGQMSTDLTFTDLAILSKPELALFDSRSLYQKMDRDVAYKVSMYGTGKIGLTAISMYDKDFVFYDKDIPLAGQEFGIVPKFKNVIWAVDEKRPWRGIVTTHLDRKLVTPVTVGQALFETSKNEFYSQSYEDMKYSKPSDFQKYVYGYEFLQPGKNYRVYPTVGFNGPFYQTLLADKYVDFTLGPPSITFKPGSKLEVLPYVGSKKIDVLTNMYNTDMEEPEGAPWLRTAYVKDEGELSVYYDDMPEDVDMRRAAIHFIGRDSLNKEVLKEDSLVVTQIRAAIHADPSYLEFDAKGGTQTVKLTTPLNDLWAELGNDKDKYITFKLDTLKMTLDVTVTENKEKDERSTALLIHGYSPGGQQGKLQLNVFQAGVGGDTPGPGPDPGTEDEFIRLDGLGKGVDVKVHLSSADYVDKELGLYSWYSNYNSEGWVNVAGVKVKLKDKSDPMNPVCSVSRDEKFYGVDTIRAKFGYMHLMGEWGSPWGVYDTRIVDSREFIIRQTSYSKEPLRVTKITFGASNDSKYENTLISSNIGSGIPGDGKYSLINNDDGSVTLKFNYEEENQSYEAWLRNRVADDRKYHHMEYPIEEGQPYKKTIFGELVLEQDSDGYYVRSGRMTYYNKTFKQNPVRTKEIEEKINGKTVKKTHYYYADKLEKGQSSILFYPENRRYFFKNSWPKLNDDTYLGNFYIYDWSEDTEQIAKQECPLTFGFGLSGQTRKKEETDE